jgi:predicted cation transporter
VAFIPESALKSKRTAILAVILSIIGLAVIPILTVPAMFLAGVRWRSAPRWTRMTLVIGAVLVVAYTVAVKSAPPEPHHG